MLHTRRRALRIAAVAAVATAGLVMTATSATAASAGADPPHARGGAAIGMNGEAVSFVIPEQERNDMLALIEAGASLKARATAWTQTGTGASITQADGSMLVVASVENSLDKDGAVVAKVTLNGNAGTNTSTRYDANGIGKYEEEFTLGATDASGMIPYTGSGKCVQGGTGVHKGEKCQYTFTGTLNPNNNVVNFNITGTTTR